MNTDYSFDPRHAKTVSVPTHEFKFNDSFKDQYNTDTAVEISGNYSYDSQTGETIVWECKADCLDWCIESPEVIRDIVEDLVREHLNVSRVTFEQTIELV